METCHSPTTRKATGSVQTAMTVEEFLARFPEVPRDLRDEAILTEYVTVFGPLLRLAQKPTPCMRDGGDAQHVFSVQIGRASCRERV